MATPMCVRDKEKFTFIETTPEFLIRSMSGLKSRDVWQKPVASGVVPAAASFRGKFILE